jgi:8-amino-7-oxononanoate synthase
MMKLITALERELQRLDREQARLTRRAIESPCAPYVEVDGRTLLSFCSNDYLGLASHPRVVQAMQEGVARYGAGSGDNHLGSGHSNAHALLEEKLAGFIAPHLESPRTLYFSTGYMANIGVLSALAGRDVDLFSESLNRASLIDGARLSRAVLKIFPHGDLDALARMLADSKADIKVVATDSVYGHDGDIAPLPAMLALCEQHGAWLVIDDAHGFGMLGENGRGVLEHFNLRSPYLIYVGTLGKAAGVSGAFVAAHETVIEWLVQRSRPYLYTPATAPALAHALLTSIDIIAGEEGAARRKQLRRLIGMLRTQVKLERWRLIPSDTAIQPIAAGSGQEAERAAVRLYAQGLWVPAVRCPAAPMDAVRLRISLSAAHADADILRLSAALRNLEQAMRHECEER